MQRRWLVLSFVCLLPLSANAQVLMQPTPTPLVSAEHETWYLNGDPVSFAGNLYYPAGAKVFFNPNEMVRSGSHLGVPFYTRTTIEPFSVIYVPVGGGRMQPYERLRTGQLVGTSGSQPPSLPSPYDPTASAGTLPQSAGSPAFGPGILAPEPAAPREPASSSAEPSSPTRAPVGTAGRPPAPQHVRIGERPQGINAVFVEYGNRRWFSAGRVVDVDPSRMQRIDDYKGFAVWQATDRADVIYMATSRDGNLAVEYALTRQDIEGLERRGRLLH